MRFSIYYFLIKHKRYSLLFGIYRYISRINSIQCFLSRLLYMRHIINIIRINHHGVYIWCSDKKSFMNERSMYLCACVLNRSHIYIYTFFFSYKTHSNRILWFLFLFNAVNFVVVDLKCVQKFLKLPLLNFIVWCTND